MAIDASEEHITQVTEFAACDRDTACRYLKVKNNDVQAAIMAIFDGEDISQAEASLAWNETAFNADRDGNTSSAPNQTSYNDDNLQPLGAPTRGSTPVPSLKQPTTSDEEDAGLQQALAASRGETHYGQQEMGTISAGKTHFGPATRSNYDSNQWAMTLPGQEVMPDLEPADRVNARGEPRCLRPLPSAEYLPNLLTILHSIPLARKALLAPHTVRTSYGQDPEWWKGHTIRMPRIVSTVDLSSAALLTPAESDELIAEMQRLIALLDSSSRSYGSVDSLLRLDAVNNVGSELPAETLSDRVLHAWEIAAAKSPADDGVDLDVFRSRMGTNDDDGVETPYMRVMPLKISPSTADHSVTLAEAMNELLWDVDDPDESDVYIEQPAQILCIHASHEDKSAARTRLVIPQSFYIDQYLKENVDQTRGLRLDIAKARHRLGVIETTRHKLEKFSLGEPKGRVDTSLLLSHTIGHFSGQNKTTMLEERLLSGADVNVDLPPPTEQHEDIATRLNALYAGIKIKLDELEEESIKARDILSRLWQSTSESLPPESLKHRYWLRGVATKSSVTYLLRPRDETSGTGDAMNIDEDAPPGMQWWRIEYDDDGNRITKSLATQDDVIRAVELEYKEALIVYASDAAIAPQDDASLPAALRDFIRNDDELFKTELQFATQVASNFETSPRDVSTRRASIDSTTVNWGDEPPPYPDPDPPAHDIMLDGVEPEDDTNMEMVETDHGPLTMKSTKRRDSDDALMMGMGRSQDGVNPQDPNLPDSMDTL
ncbi:hypothetical protein AAFC00_002920 [Neodothiora populina]|uniref:UBA domain-containing protein n=1 Tax=Neodothiora populina TaxID=2781224 RepID=A0ABR3P8N9_9PEZI